MTAADERAGVGTAAGAADVAAGAGGGAWPEPVLLDEVGSTNDEVRELGRGTASAGTAVAARRQTAGRGRRGHLWHSPDGGLYLSVLLRPEVGMRQLMGLSAVCSLGVADALAALGAPGAALKWPNDVVVGERKLAGVLVEAGYGELGTFAVCGVGVNVEPSEGLGRAVAETFDGSQRPLEPAFLAACARERGVEPPGFAEAARVLRDSIMARVGAWEAAVAAGRAAAGPLAPVLDEYFERMPAVGRAMDAVMPDGRVMATGTFSGMDVWGRAILVTEAGEEISVAAEQASLRPHAATRLPLRPQPPRRLGRPCDRPYEARPPAEAARFSARWRQIR